MRYKFKYTSSSVEEMLPWELSIEMAMISADIEKENMKRVENK